MPLSYEELITQGRVWYKAIKEVYCPILDFSVIFNAKGFHHLLYDGHGKARTRKERMYRLGLLPLIIPVLKRATKIEEYTAPCYSKKLKKMTEYWRLKAVVGKQEAIVTVILRRIGTGHVTFHSVWKKPDRKKQTKKPST